MLPNVKYSNMKMLDMGCQQKDSLMKYVLCLIETNTKQTHTHKHTYTHMCAPPNTKVYKSIRMANAMP